MSSIEFTKNINNQINKKLLLGILDNCRNVLLVLINNYLVSNYFYKNILLDISLNFQNGNSKSYRTKDLDDIKDDSNE